MISMTSIIKRGKKCGCGKEAFFKIEKFSYLKGTEVYLCSGCFKRLDDEPNKKWILVG